MSTKQCPFISICIVILFYLNCFNAIPNQQIHNYNSFNLTKRPLNLYIIANGKHAKVNNLTLELSSANENHASSAKSSSANNGHIDYRISQPPFAIKRRGSIILLHNITGNSVSWDQGRPSLIQMLAASGHTTVAVELSKTNIVNANVKRIREIIVAEHLRNITFISADKNAEQYILYLLGADKNGKTFKSDENADIEALTDGVILLYNSSENIQKWRKILSNLPSENVLSVLLLEKSNKQNPDSQWKDLESVKFEQFNDELDQSEDTRLRLMQILANYFDFIHPR